MKDYIIRKIKSKRGDKYKYEYYDKEGKKVNEKIVKICLEGIYIPPAHDNVKINLNKKDKVLAIGYDTKGRPQYIYNKRYTEKKSKEKYEHMIEFGESYKKIMKQINKDLYTEGDSKQKQIAFILKLVIDCCFRIGNDKYMKENKSYGVSTLLSEHVKVSGENIMIDFKGKKGVQNRCKFRHKKLSKELRRKKKTLKKKDRLFTYREKDKYHEVNSKDVNKYLKKFGNFSTKNFRTWNANIEFILQIIEKEEPQTENQKKKNIKEAIKKVAEKLHNTSSVCKSNYIDPYLVETYEKDTRRFIGTFRETKKRDDLTDKYIELLRNR